MLLAASASPLARGNDAPGANYEHLKCFEQLVGEWVYDGPAPEAVADIVEKGDRVYFALSWKWIFNKSAIRTKFTFEVLQKSDPALDAVCTSLNSSIKKLEVRVYKEKGTWTLREIKQIVKPS